MTAPPRPNVRPTDLEALLPLLKLVADGLTNAQIARRMNLGESTVKQRLRPLYEHLGARDRAHAVALGFQRGYLRRSEPLDAHASTCALLVPRTCDCKGGQR